MGELVDLAEWKKKKDEEEVREIQEDIEHLHSELKQLISEMESDVGPYFYTEDWIKMLPQLSHISHTLDGYADWEIEYTGEEE